MNIYKQNTANFPRNDTDVFFDIPCEKEFGGIMAKNLKFIEDFQLKDTNAWKNFVLQFKGNPDDADAGWRGEYWGKMMRGACFVYSYSKDKELYKILKDTVLDMMSAQDSLGRISTYSVEHEFDGWDMWARKYVLLGLQYFLEICENYDLCEKITDCMCRQADYIISKIGDTDGKLPITKATRHWRGVNSCSVLEPMVRLYSLTEDKKYLDFAEYIVNCGACEVENIFKLAYNNELRPYQYPVTKAYEMTSCFMGLLEYYRITQNEYFKTCVINFANCILEDEFTVIGSCGCTHELFDHSAVRQANTTNGDIAQETCVTVTIMQFFYQLSLLTGDSRYMDAFEISLYNAYLGAVNTEKVIGETAKQKYPDLENIPLAFDSYSPLTAGTRGNGIGGLKRMENGFHYGCCACIGSAGIGLAMKSAVFTTEKGIVINLFEKGDLTAQLPNGKQVNISINTDYPKDKTVSVTVNSNGSFEILIRNPYWSENTQILLNGKNLETNNGYVSINREWTVGDKIEIEFDMRTKAIYPIPYGSQVLMNRVVWGANYMVPTFDKEDPKAKNHIALQRGPLMLAQENRLGYSVDDPVSIKVDKDGFVDTEISQNKTAPYGCIIEAKVPTKNGADFTVTDYASAGKLYNKQSKMAVWMFNE